MCSSDLVLALTLDYGQRAARREIAAAGRIAARGNVEHLVIRLPWLAGGALTDRGRPLPRPDLRRAADVRASARAVWVPNRNGVFIAVAASVAERRGADAVIVGFNREEASTFPDNSAAFLRATNRALAFSTANRLRVVGPTAAWDKARIVREARLRGFDLSGIWPCYGGGRRWCRRCESCLRALRAGVRP